MDNDVAPRPNEEWVGLLDNSRYTVLDVMGDHVVVTNHQTSEVLAYEVPDFWGRFRRTEQAQEEVDKWTPDVKAILDRPNHRRDNRERLREKIAQKRGRRRGG